MKTLLLLLTTFGVPVTVLAQTNGQEVTLMGTLRGGRIAIGGETTGWAIEYRDSSGEHSIEVQLPFLQRLSAALSLVPIAIAMADYEVLEQLGRAVADAIRCSTEPVLIVASSDLNHYEPEIITREKDDRAIEKILQLDPRGLLEVIRDQDISMCGYAPTIAMLTAAKSLGARDAQLVRHATSADTGGDTHSVVGYAGIIVN